jgi:hypothetical protein
LDGEYADEDGSDTEAQVNWNIATERDKDFSRDIDAGDFLSGEADTPVFRILFLKLPLPTPDGRIFAIRRHISLQSIDVHFRCKASTSTFVAKHRRPHSLQIIDVH